MNKILLTFVAFLCFTLSINASNSNDGKYKYTVTVLTEKVYYYYDQDGCEVGSETKTDKTYTIDNVWADNPEQAENKAKNKCSTMCRTSIPEKEGMKTYQGKLYSCKSITRIFSAQATVAF